MNQYYIGIDLGTTNSAICSYDGENVRIWKSPEQNDVTPSAIYADKRGNRYYGTKAYQQASYNPKNAAVLFKRYMGTNTQITLEAAGITMTPEECSAEILKVLYGYLPEEIRESENTSVVITVPAAFNQMKKDATLQAAKLAGISRVALMQEPVAAVMSIMRQNHEEGIFLVYDLGGGTFDISIAENVGGKVRLLSHGGIEMCGGRDIDRRIVREIVVPWLQKHFSLPGDFSSNPRYRSFYRIVQWAAERAKIELSSAETSTIALSESEARTLDENGEEMYLDIDLNRSTVTNLISDLIHDTIEATKEALQKTGIVQTEVNRIVFIGGPTNYKPLRDAVSSALGIPASLDVNPMTAVAEGASIFAESIDWSTESHNRKSTSRTVATEIDLTFRYTARTSEDTARILCLTGNMQDPYEIQFTSLDTGWSSGSAKLTDRLVMTLPLAQNGENRFSVMVSDSRGNFLRTGVPEIVITRTMATIGAIPASNSIGVEIVDRVGGESALVFLVSEGDPLPKRGHTVFRAGQQIRSGSNDSINIKLWEGSILSPVTDNRFIGVLKIRGTDVQFGMIPTGAEIECDYEMTDSGTIRLEVSIPCIGATFGNRNFYSRQEGQTDLADVDTVAEEGRQVQDRIRKMLRVIDDDRLLSASQKALQAAQIDSSPDADPEDVQKAINDLLDAKKLINLSRQDHLKSIRQLELDRVVLNFQPSEQYATPSEKQIFERLKAAAQRSIDNDDTDFENILDSMNKLLGGILFRQDWYIIKVYQSLTVTSSRYMNPVRYTELKKLGDQAVQSGDISSLRSIVAQLINLLIPTEPVESMFDVANILKG